MRRGCGRRPAAARERGKARPAAPAIRRRARCRMHGGAAGSGAPPGNRNAFKGGFHTAAARLERVSRG